MAADSKVIDMDRGVLSKTKLFRLTDNCVAAIAGMGLKDDLDTFMATLEADIADKNIQGVSSIAKHVKEFTENRGWAEWDDPNKSHMIVMIGGYDGSVPKVFIRLSTGVLEGLGFGRYVIGNWDGAVDYLVEAFQKKTYKKIDFTTAEKVSIEMLVKGELANPAQIGGQGTLWHIHSRRTETKSATYIAKLQERYV